MAGVVSVERFTITLSSGTSSNSATLTKSQTTANCIPFFTKRMTTGASTDDDWAESNVDCYFSGSTVVVETVDNTPRVCVVDVAVVEFDGTSVEVQQGTYSMGTSATSTTATITAVTLADAFAIAPHKQTATIFVNAGATVRTQFNSTTQLGFSRGGTGGTINGHWYVAEATSGDFSVQTSDITVTGTSNTGTITSVTTGKTFLVGSYTADSGTADDNADIPYLELTNATTITLDRVASGGTIVATVFAISFTGNEVVQRGILVQSSSTASEDLDITTVDLTVAMAWTPATQSFKNASAGGSSSNKNGDVQVGISFVDNDTIRFQHLTDGNEPMDISWEVIEWELNAAPTARRIFVIS